jgi:CheY-like chemotaxis protein
MSIDTAKLAIHLPYLRRFARVLTGSQDIGDSYALLALEAAISTAPPSLDDVDVSNWLFRALLKVWSSVGQRTGQTGPETDDLSGAADRQLRMITPLPRAAFLLQSMEEFSLDRVANVLEISPDEAAALVTQAASEIAAQISTDVLIIEDELIISMDLASLVEDLGHRVVGVARTHAEAIAAVVEHSPGLVLADIQLADQSSGLDAVKEILGQHEIPVVFITAYPEQVLTGTRPEPTFLVAKPFRVATLKAVISQALFFDMRARYASVSPV